ncbi:MAG TPA: hypothetical protein VH479_08900 [Acidimicrobiales bacterium]
MTDVQVRDTPEVRWEPRGHPVRWLLVLVATVALASAVSIWFGLLTPRVSVQPSRWDADPARGDGALAVEVLISNQAHAAVKVTGAGRRIDGIEFEGTDDLPTTIPAGETIAVTLYYRILDCDLARGVDLAGPFVMQTPLGIPRGVEPPGFYVDALVDPVCPPG